jgi:hypothetical protein
MSAPHVSVAAEVWVAAALLHREQPDRSAFSVAEIVDRARREALVPTLRPGVTAYAAGHAVANKRPSPNTLRFLYEPEPRLRRLFRTGDPSDPGRHGKTTPQPEDLPAPYRGLLRWYADEYNLNLAGDVVSASPPAATPVDRVNSAGPATELTSSVTGSRSAADILVITSCTSDKLFKPPNALTEPDFRAPERLARRTAQLRDYQAGAGEMYRGLQHIAVMDGLRLLRTYGVRVDLSVISAGYGLVSEDCEIVPYDVTFATMSPLQIRAWADWLKIPSAVRLAVRGYTIVVLLLGESYLTAIDPPLEAAAGQQLFFFARPGERRVHGLGVHHIPAGIAQLPDYPGASGISLKGVMFRALARAIAAEPRKTLDALAGNSPLTAMMDALQTGRER